MITFVFREDPCSMLVINKDGYTVLVREESSLTKSRQEMIPSLPFRMWRLERSGSIPTRAGMQISFISKLKERKRCND